MTNSSMGEGRQIYIVYPLIKESEKIDIKNLEEGYEHVCAEFPECKVSKVHGQMKPAEKDAEMQRFVNGETQIMVATTVIEVGVNVPNASVMVIENAERFGLSQLHQLRGRVGRGRRRGGGYDRHATAGVDAHPRAGRIHAFPQILIGGVHHGQIRICAQPHSG